MQQQTDSQARARSRKKLVGNILVLIVVIPISYCSYRMIANGDDLRDFCSTLKPGMTPAQVQEAVDAKRYSLQAGNYEGHNNAMIMVPSAYPPNNCYVEYTDDKVTTAHYIPFN